MCAVLGDNRVRLLPDSDGFRFQGVANSRVTVSLTENRTPAQGGWASLLRWHRLFKGADPWMMSDICASRF